MSDLGTWKVLPDQPLYEEALATEAHIWGAERGPFPQDHYLRVAYQNEVVTGDPSRDVLEWLAESYGPFDSACSLACGTGRVELRLLSMGAVSRMWACDASATALESFLRQGGGAVRGQTADLNFIDLPAEAFDLVMVWEAMHHVINLERLLHQVSRCLKPGGLFLVRDFVGETRWQWTDDKRRAVNGILMRIRGAVPAAPVKPLGRYVNSIMSPFESIRSADIVPLLHHIFGSRTILERRWEGLCHDALGVVDYDRPGLPVDRAVGMLIGADREQLVAPGMGRIQPCTLFGLYRKPDQVAPPSVLAWTPDELEDRLDVIRYLSPGKQLKSRGKRWFHSSPWGRVVWKAVAALIHTLEGRLQLPAPIEGGGSSLTDRRAAIRDSAQR